MEQQVARALIEVGAVGFSPDQPVTFKSGLISPVYVDNRSLPFHPAQWRVIIEGFARLIDSAQIDFEIIAGVAVGGVPHSAALAYQLQKPSVFVRKEAKEHGKKKLVEGGNVQDQRVLLVEDLVTTGGSSLAGLLSLRAEGARVDDLITIVSYGFTEATTAFSAAGVRLHSLTHFSAILDEAVAMGRFDEASHRIISDWFHDPYGWAERHGFA